MTVLCAHRNEVKVCDYVDELILLRLFTVVTNGSGWYNTLSHAAKLEGDGSSLDNGFSIVLELGKSPHLPKIGARLSFSRFYQFFMSSLRKPPEFGGDEMPEEERGIDLRLRNLWKTGHKTDFRENLHCVFMYTLFNFFKAILLV